MSKTGATPLIELLSHVRGQVNTDRRNDERKSLVTPAEVVAVDADLKPVGAPFEAVTRDVSTCGIGLITGEDPATDQVALQLLIDGEEKTLLCGVMWNEPSGPFKFIGLDVIRTLDGFPSTGNSFTSLTE